MDKLSKEQFVQIRNWIYRNARPLDLARWRYHFEQGTKEEVLEALAAYQNIDGGFGHALEADSWNINSTPIQTWCATEILYDLEITDKNNEIVKGILKYLNSKQDFKQGYWLAATPSNNDYPHAPWWTYGENVIENWGYNPTIALVGFILYFEDKETKLYKLALEIAEKAVDLFLNTDNVESMHQIACFIRFYEYCTKAGVTELFNTDMMLNRLKQKVKVTIGQDKEAWKDTYLCKPSQFMVTPKSIFYMDNKELSDYEVSFIIDTLSSEGTWSITWDWADYPKQWAISKNWWKANVILKNLMYLKDFNCL